MKKVNWIREELSTVKKGAKRNNEFAMYELATRYLTDRSVTYDEVSGIYWACQAATHGNPRGMVLAGYCLIRGIGCSEEEPEDRFREAVGWFEDAARLGNATAYYNLGGCYLLGIGKNRSKKAALVYYRAASEKGCKRAAKAIAAIEAADTKTLTEMAETAQLLLVA